ncbi:MAG: transposase [Actinobacteria bacterium]|nr:transposase [Actinomycetota bacterium]
MARPLRIEFENAFYHITSRGNAGNNIFLKKEDFKDFLEILESVIDRYSWMCHAYSLMDNHYHLLIETPKANLSLGMRQLNGVYTQSFNRRHKSYGHIFQGRFKAILIDKQAYLLELSRYIVLNPVRAKIVSDPKDYEWSSYSVTAGIVKQPSLLEKSYILSQFGKNIKKAKQRYIQFVYDGINKESPWILLRNQFILGDDDFIDEHKSKLKEKVKDGEIPILQRRSAMPTLNEIFKHKELSDKVKKDQMIYSAFKHGYKLNEISSFLNIHYSTASRAVKRAERRKD